MNQRLVFLCGALSLAIHVSGQADTVTTNYRGEEERWKMVFHDEFDGQRINNDVWVVANGVVRDHFQQTSQHWFDPDMVRVRNGYLELWTEPDTTRDRPFSIWVTDGMKEFTGDFNFIAGEIDSREKFSFGMFEIRCKIPKGRGLCPAFWLYGEKDGVNHEIDVFEFWNQGSWFRKYDPKKLSRVQNMTVHHKGRMSGMNAGVGPDYSADFHTFSVIWDECAIRWYTDGKLVRTQYRWKRMRGQTKDCGSMTNGGKENVFPQAPMNIIFNVAVHNEEKSPDSTNVWPQVMMVDYVRYYQRVE